MSHFGPTTSHNNGTRSQNSENCRSVIGQFYRKRVVDPISTSRKRGCEMHCGSTRMDVVSAFSDLAQGNVTSKNSIKNEILIILYQRVFYYLVSLVHTSFTPYFLLLNNASYPHIYKHSSLSMLANAILPLVVVNQCFLNNQANLSVQKTFLL